MKTKTKKQTEKCRRCGGSGEVVIRRARPLHGAEELAECFFCKGSGEVNPEDLKAEPIYRGNKQVGTLLDEYANLVV